MMQPPKKLSIFDAAADTTAGVTRTYGGIHNCDGVKIVGGTTRSAAGEQVYGHAKRATSPAGSASEGPPKNERDAAGAQNDVVEHAAQLIASLSRLLMSEIAGKCPPHTDEDSEKGDALSDTERSTRSASPTTPPSEYGETDEGHDFVVGDGMESILWPTQDGSSQ